MEKFDRKYPIVFGWSRSLREDIGQHLQDMRDEKGRYPESIQVKLSIPRNTRSIDQNALYWAWNTEIMDFMNKMQNLGWDKDDTHRWVKSQFFIDLDEFEELIRKLKEGMPTGEFLQECMKIIDKNTTTNKNTVEFSEKLKAIQKYFAPLGLDLRFPDEPPLI